MFHARIFSTLLDQPVASEIIIHNLHNVIGQVCVVYRLCESIKNLKLTPQ